MINKNKYIQIVSIVVIIIAIIIIVFYSSKKEEVKTVEDGNIGITLTEDSGNAEVKQIPIVDINNVTKEQELNYPDFNRTVVFPDSFSEEARVIINNNITTLRANLEKDKDSVGDWLDLAMQYKIIEDYKYTRDIWEFLSASFTVSSTVLNNLRDLYHYNLKDFPKAEENFRKTIENDKSNIQAYLGLHELYKYSYKQETSMVTGILIEGIEANPSNTDLLVTLAAYYKDIEDNTNAKKYYEQARDEAQKLGNIQLVELLDVELSKF